VSKSTHPKTVETLLNYDWPGNVRELENVIERLVVTAATDTIDDAGLTEQMFSAKTPEGSVNWSDPAGFETRGSTLKDVLEDVERVWLERAYRQCRSTREMARVLGMSQATVVRRLRRYGIARNRKT